MTLWRNRGSFWLLNLFIIEIEWHFVWWMYHTYSQMSCFVTGIYLFKEYSGFVTWISSCGTVECTVSIYGTSGFVAWIYPFKKLSGFVTWININYETELLFNVLKVTFDSWIINIRRRYTFCTFVFIPPLEQISYTDNSSRFIVLIKVTNIFFCSVIYQWRNIVAFLFFWQFHFLHKIFAWEYFVLDLDSFLFVNILFQILTPLSLKCCLLLRFPILNMIDFHHEFKVW